MPVHDDSKLLIPSVMLDIDDIVRCRLDGGIAVAEGGLSFIRLVDDITDSPVELASWMEDDLGLHDDGHDHHGLAIDQLAHRNDTTAFDSYSASMGFTHRTYLGGNKIYACAVCRTHMATIESMMSRVGAATPGQLR